jgi:hypothetical protein
MMFGSESGGYDCVYDCPWKLQIPSWAAR